MNLTCEEIEHWLDCLKHLMKTGTSIDELYSLLEKEQDKNHELMELSQISYC
jgi:DNA-binding transcriptional MerR regulator